ncbi:MAG: LysM peptidoglycan-binding domain-containing protein [Mogibacterium sp.]|nr:LysM peptidoglycan-binding domain-containing protein [Mogibacterium sp.]
MRKHSYRITNPVRFFIFILLSIMIIVFAGYSIIGAGNAEAATARKYAQVTIQENDTLWDLACSYNPERLDIRDIVHEIYDINDISADDIHPGDVVFIPVY